MSSTSTWSFRCRRLLAAILTTMTTIIDELMATTTNKTITLYETNMGELSLDDEDLSSGRSAVWAAAELETY